MANKFKRNTSWLLLINDAAETALLRVAERLGNEIRKDVRKDTGELARSIKPRRVKKLHVRLATNKIQWFVEEFGRRPWRFPNMDAITRRAIRKRIVSGTQSKWYDWLTAKNKGTVFVVARSIAKRGIRARKTFSNHFERFKPFILTHFRREYTKQARDFIRPK